MELLPKNQTYHMKHNHVVIQSTWNDQLWLKVMNLSKKILKGECHICSVFLYLQVSLFLSSTTFSFFTCCFFGIKWMEMPKHYNGNIKMAVAVKALLCSQKRLFPLKTSLILSPKLIELHIITYFTPWWCKVNDFESKSAISYNIPGSKMIPGNSHYDYPIQTNSNISRNHKIEFHTWSNWNSQITHTCGWWYCGHDNTVGLGTTYCDEQRQGVGWDGGWWGEGGK